MATDPTSSIAHALARRGYRLTRPRRAVLEAVARAQEPVTVGAIHEAIGGRRANLVSVYRTVNLLSAIGLLRVLHGGVGRREARYELNEPFSGHHHHLVCQACGRIEDVAGCLIPDDDLARVSRRLLRLRRFRVTEHDLRLLGTCQTCEV